MNIFMLLIMIIISLLISECDCFWNSNITVSGPTSTSSLSQSRYYLSGASSFSKIVFAGGYLPSGQVSGVVDIFDEVNDNWSTWNLSVPRYFLTGIGSKNENIFFAGGTTNTSAASSVVDIYEVNNNIWSTSTLSIPRYAFASGSLENQVLFAGGYNYWWDSLG